MRYSKNTFIASLILSMFSTTKSVDNSILAKSIINKIYLTNYPVKFGYSEYEGSYKIDANQNENANENDVDITIKSNLLFAITHVDKTWDFDAGGDINIYCIILNDVPIKDTSLSVKHLNNKKISDLMNSDKTLLKTKNLTSKLVYTSFFTKLNGEPIYDSIGEDVNIDEPIINSSEISKQQGKYVQQSTKYQYGPLCLVIIFIILLMICFYKLKLQNS